MTVTYIKDYRNGLAVWQVYVNGTLAKEFETLTAAVSYRNRLTDAYRYSVAA